MAMTKEQLITREHIIHVSCIHTVRASHSILIKEIKLEYLLLQKTTYLPNVQTCCFHVFNSKHAIVVWIVWKLFLL
jgi:hypothetical protein